MYICLRVQLQQFQMQQQHTQTREKNITTDNCAPFTNCISEIKKTQIDNVKDIDIAMPMYSLIEYSDKYFKIRGGLWHYY